MAKKNNKKKKEVVRIAKLQFNAGQAKPGPALAGLGINMPEFTRGFNDVTRERNGEPCPVRITIYSDKSFEFEVKTAPTSFKLKQAANIKSGAKNSKVEIAATITLEDAKKIAEYKLVDMNTDDIEMAIRQVAGTAKNMGIKIEGIDDLKKAKEEIAQAQKNVAQAEKLQEKLDQDSQAAAEYKNQEMEVTVIADENKPKETNGDDK